MSYEDFPFPERLRTEDARDESQGELRGEEGEEPGGRVEAGADLLLLQVGVQPAVVVVQQPRELVHLDLGGENEKTNTTNMFRHSLTHTHTHTHTHTPHTTHTHTRHRSEHATLQQKSGFSGYTRGNALVSKHIIKVPP